MLYGLFVGVVIYLLNKKINLKTVLNKWLILIVLVSVVSLLVNWYSSFTWALGMRQLFRFILVFFVAIMLLIEVVVLGGLERRLFRWRPAARLA